MEQKGIFTKDTVGNGVFIFTDSKKFVSPDFWELYKESERACCVAIVRDGMVLFVAPEDYKNRRVILLGYEKNVSSKEFRNINEALKDVDGIGNTERLSQAGSLVATDVLSMDLAGLRWHIPTLKELQECYDNKYMLCESLSISGLMLLKDDWYWLSTKYNDKCNYILFWENSFMLDAVHDNSFNVRPVSAVSLSEL